MNKELTIQELETSLRLLPTRIREESAKCVDLQEKWRIIEAEYDLLCAKELMKAKINNPNLTGPELKAIVTEVCHPDLLKVITAEAIYNRAETFLDELNNKFVAVRKICELRRIAGHGEGG